MGAVGISGIHSFRRSSEGLWVLQTYVSTSETFSLSSVNYEEALAAAYENVIFDKPTVAQSNS